MSHRVVYTFWALESSAREHMQYCFISPMPLVKQRLLLLNIAGRADLTGFSRDRKPFTCALYKPLNSTCIDWPCYMSPTYPQGWRKGLPLRVVQT